MIVTPFGEVKFGDTRTLEVWQDAHARRHGVVGKAAGVPTQHLRGTMDADWFTRHWSSHATNAAKLNIRSATPTVVLAKWRDAVEFDDWHRAHALMHLREDQAAGIVNGN
jgi:hypothetical protein